MSDRLALANAIEDAGIDRGKAERMASVIVDLIHDQVATTADVQTLGSELRADLRATEARLDAKITRLDAKIDLVEHRMLTRLGGLMMVVGAVLFAALRYWPPHG